ncbi:MAG: DUF305 domain-containing protein [Bacteroidota bacterium]
MEHTAHSNKNTEHTGHYGKLFFMVLFSFIAMYILMFAMADSIKNVYPNINQFYMAALMSMPMLVIELALMGKMYPNKKLNSFLIFLGSIGVVAFFLLIQFQTAVSDKQFLKGMIPHHSAAILMSEQSKSTDTAIQKLQSEIISSQKKEIEIMKTKLKEMESPHFYQIPQPKKQEN